MIQGPHFWYVWPAAHPLAWWWPFSAWTAHRLASSKRPTRYASDGILHHVMWAEYWELGIEIEPSCCPSSHEQAYEKASDISEWLVLFWVMPNIQQGESPRLWTCDSSPLSHHPCLQDAIHWWKPWIVLWLLSCMGHRRLLHWECMGSHL